MRPIDVVQWVCLALIAAGTFLVSVRVGLICTGVLGIVGSTIYELAAARDRPAMSEAQAAEEARTNMLGFRRIRRDRSG